MLINLNANKKQKLKILRFLKEKAVKSLIIIILNWIILKSFKKIWQKYFLREKKSLMLWIC